jgi:hypothetical protein
MKIWSFLEGLSTIVFTELIKLFNTKLPVLLNNPLEFKCECQKIKTISRSNCKM